MREKTKPGNDHLDQVPRFLHGSPQGGDDVSQAADFRDGCHLDSDVNHVEPGLGQRGTLDRQLVVAASAVVVACVRLSLSGIRKNSL